LESILEAVNVTGDELLDELMDIEAAMPAAVDLAPVGQAISEGLGAVVQVLEDIRDAMPAETVTRSTFSDRLQLLVDSGQLVNVEFLDRGTAYVTLDSVGADYVEYRQRPGGSEARYIVPFAALRHVNYYTGG
jgi:hypothetical protein